VENTITQRIFLSSSLWSLRQQALRTTTL